MSETKGVVREDRVRMEAGSGAGRKYLGIWGSSLMGLFLLRIERIRRVSIFRFEHEHILSLTTFAEYNFHLIFLKFCIIFVPLRDFKEKIKSFRKKKKKIGLPSTKTDLSLKKQTSPNTIISRQRTRSHGSV